jgi:hypothetical protein
VGGKMWNPLEHVDRTTKKNYVIFSWLNLLLNKILLKSPLYLGGPSLAESEVLHGRITQNNQKIWPEARIVSS